MMELPSYFVLNFLFCEHLNSNGHRFHITNSYSIYALVFAMISRCSFTAMPCTCVTCPFDFLATLLIAISVQMKKHYGFMHLWAIQQFIRTLIGYPCDCNCLFSMQVLMKWQGYYITASYNYVDIII